MASSNDSKTTSTESTSRTSESAAEGSSESTDSSYQVTGFEWELEHENVKPLRGGRRVEAINNALTHQSKGAETIAKAKLDEMMNEAETSDDPLKICLSFCTWFDEHFPIGRQKIYYKLLWKIVNKYAKEERYLEDERMLKLWEKLADNSLGHGWEVYQHANTIGSLIRCAQLYVRWSLELELRSEISEARRVLRRGLHVGAVPRDVLHAGEDELETRELRRELDRQRDANNSWEGEMDHGEDDLDDNGQRVAFTRIQGIGDTHIAPVIRLPAVVGEKGSSRLDKGVASTSKSNAPGSGFQVYADGDNGDLDYLQSVYEMDNHLQRFSIEENDPERMRASKVAIKKVPVPSSSNFFVWQDDKENIDPKDGVRTTKARLMLKKCLIRDMSIEEHMAEMYPTLVVHDKVVRKIDFDLDD